MPLRFGPRAADQSEAFDRRALIAASVAIALASIAVRLPFLIVRSPFFDELYSKWIAGKSFSGVVEALRLDSGPPLYYWLLSAWTAVFSNAILSLRSLSLLCGVAAIVAVLFFLHDTFEARLTAALLLLLWPTHAYYSTEARSYALCALLAGVGTLALDGWMERGRRSLLVAAAVSIAASAWVHYYGALFAPLLLLLPLIERRRALLRAAAGATIGVAITLIPLFLLLSAQPSEAMAWGRRRMAASVALSIVEQLQFAAPYPSAVMPSAPLPARLFAIAIAIFVIVPAALRSARLRRWLLIIAIPSALVVAFVAIGVNSYFPARFESVLSIPFTVALALGIVSIPRPWLKRTVAISLAALGGLVWASSVRAFALGEDDPLRTAAVWTRASIDPSRRIVASGYLWLEIESQRDRRWSPPLRAFPCEQAQHPGWSGRFDRQLLVSEAARIARSESDFIWVGTRRSAEAAALARHFALRPLFEERGIVVAAASRHRVHQLEQKHQQHPEGEIDPDPGVVR